MKIKHFLLVGIAMGTILFGVIADRKNWGNVVVIDILVTAILLSLLLFTRERKKKGGEMR